MNDHDALCESVLHLGYFTSCACYERSLRLAAYDPPRETEANTCPSE